MNYKEKGIDAFLKSEFSLAQNLFSIAYSQSQEEELLFLINLSKSALKNKEEALVLFDLYLLRFNDTFTYKDLEKILDDSYFDKTRALDELEKENAISYTDFKNITKKDNDFKETFENIILSTKISIMGKDELLSFLEDLVNNNFIEMSFAYLETALLVYGSDDRILNIIKKIKNNENKITK